MKFQSIRKLLSLKSHKNTGTLLDLLSASTTEVPDNHQVQ
jgi:hypothetical protein